MKIGELVEMLIRIRDDLPCWEDRDAMADACNILNELPQDYDVKTVREFIRQAVNKGEK